MGLTPMIGSIVMMTCWKGLDNMGTLRSSLFCFKKAKLSLLRKAKISRPSLFWCKEAQDGFSTVGMVLALLVTLSLIFTCAKVYEINSVSARVQETTDAAALAAENTVGEFYVLVTICDAVTFTMSLTTLVTLGIGVVCACVPPLASVSSALIKASIEIGNARDSFHETSSRSLGTLERALPFIAMARAGDVLQANSGERESDYVGIVVLSPWQGQQAESLSFDSSDAAQDMVVGTEEELSSKAAEAEQAAQSANEWKKRAYMHDSGSKTEYCMYERASSLAGMNGSSNPYFSSMDTWNFQAALSRAKTYYQLRYESETPKGSSVNEQANSALRKRFYEYAAETVGKGYVHETADSFDALFPLLPKNTEEMRDTTLYTDEVYPRTQDAQGFYTLHAWEGCPGCSGALSAGIASIAAMDGNDAYVTCSYCGFSPSSMGKVASASSNINNGFEYHYNEVAQAAREYQKAISDLGPLNSEVKTLAGGALDRIFDGVAQVCSKRIRILPPGHWGAVAIVTDRSAPASNFPSTFVLPQGTEALGPRLALSAATLVRESSDEGKDVLTSFLDGLDPGSAATGASKIVLKAWSALLGVYANGQESLESAIEGLLNGIPLASASGLGMWAADEFKRRVADAGFDPPDLLSRKAVLVNSAHVLEADPSGFSARLLAAKNAVIDHGEGGVQGAVSAVESLAHDAVSALSSDFTVATIVLLEGKVEIPITISLPSSVTEGISGLFQAGIDQLYSVATSWTGARQWR